MAKTWSDAAVRNLTNWTACPRCDRPLSGGWCPNCGADLTGPVGLELAEASRAAVAALENRQAVLERLPNSAGPQRTPVTAPAPVAPRPVVAAPVAPEPTSTVSVQSVLAVAGAGLFAIAAIVFTFFNEGLTDLTTRSITVAIISLVFLGAAWLLARGGLQFSAEAVGALAMVFVVLDVWAISTAPHAGLGDLAVAAIVTTVASGLMIGLASIRRLRTWLWSGLVGLAISPLLFGLAVDTAWSATLGWLGLGLVALLTHEVARRLQRRFDSALLVDHATATILQFSSVLAALALMFTLPVDTDAQRVVNVAVVLGALTLLSLLATRNAPAPVWSYLAGAFATAAVAILPLVHAYPSDEWILALVPAAAAGALAIVAALTTLRLGTVGRGALLGGSTSIVAATIAPAGFVALAHLATVGSDEFEAPVVLAAVLAGTAVALALLVVTVVLRNSVFGVISLSIGLVAVATMATWTGFDHAVRVALTLCTVVALVALLRMLPIVRTAPRRLRAPLVTAAHVLVVLTPVLTRHDSLLTVFGGIGVVVAIVALALVMPKVAQPVYAAIAFAYALFVFTFTLVEFTVLSVFAVIGLTTVLAILVAIAVTLLRRIPVAFWYAALTVAALPFLVSIGSMLFGISGWVGLSTGVSLLLFLTLTVLHRDGLGRLLRAGAASLLLPGLAVVVISLVAQFTVQSASPITLPIVAALVALTLPCTTLIGRFLLARGHSDEDVAAVRFLLEISALVTGSLAVLLTLLRAAAGFETTFLVLVIVGLGAAATGQFVRRRYAWYVAFISFTGALWALLALNTVTELEPYVLPPALAAAAIGAVAVARGKNGLAFYSTGLAVAVATPLLVLARSGNGAGAVEWRTYGLLAGAVVLVAAGLLLERSVKLARLREATVFVGLGAASAGVVQAVRYGSGRDLSIYGTGEAVMLPALLFSLLAAAIATTAGVLLVRNQRIAASRWAFVPALVFLVVGPITAFRHGTVYSWTLLVLMAAVLAVMIVTVMLARTRAVTLPPVWVTFAIATAAGIAGWSEHTVFRVEAYSIPLGLALLAVGIIAWRHAPDDEPFITRWPLGFTGSWPLLAPGIFVVLTVSIMSTLTDPRTERAILVIALALVAILLGNRLRLAAPFFLGIAALPLENLIVFGVQIGDKIEATTWWITLASAGAVLLVLAVSSERRASGEGGVAARLRDLR
jgi:hypothetical protein